MNKKSLLITITSGMTLVGLIFLSVTFLSYLSLTPKQENDAWIACEVSDLQPGAIRKCGWNFVYRRTEQDKLSNSKFLFLLADPNSDNSKQPAEARNQWRSENPDFFVFKSMAPIRGCQVEFKEPGSIGWDVPEKVAVEALPYFFEPCDGRTWDTSGRLYLRTGYPPEKNLIVPKVHWLSKYNVHIYGSWL